MPAQPQRQLHPRPALRSREEEDKMSASWVLAERLQRPTQACATRFN